MAILKPAESRPLLKNAVVLDLGDLLRQAERMIEQARREAAAIIEQGREEAKNLIAGASAKGWEQGHTRGLAEGREEGREKGREEAFAEKSVGIEKMNIAWSEAVERWEKERGDMLLAAREDVLAFAFALGEKVVHRLVKHDPTVIQDQLKAALSRLGERTAVTVRVHPFDRALAAEVLPHLMHTIEECEHIDMRDDESMEPGGCRVQTRGGSIDATIETQLDRLAEVLLPHGRLGGETEGNSEDGQDEIS